MNDSFGPGLTDFLDRRAKLFPGKFLILLANGVFNQFGGCSDPAFPPTVVGLLPEALSKPFFG